MGTSPTVTVKPITSGTKVISNEVTITDEEGDHVFNVLNGVDAVNPFKGIYGSDNKPTGTFASGDYIYAPDSTDGSTTTIWYWDETLSTWSDSSKAIDPAALVEFANTSKPVAATKVVNDLTTGGVDDVLSAEQGKILNEKCKDTIKGSSINLYDNREGYVVGYINASGSISANTSGDYLISQPIEIKPNTVYAFSVIGMTANSCYLRFLKADGTTKTLPLNPNNNDEPFSSYSSVFPSILVKSPSDAYYVQFTVKFGNTDIRDNVQLIETDILPNEYYPYSFEMSYENLPKQLLEEIDSKAEYEVEKSQNLFNKNSVGFINGQYIKITGELGGNDVTKYKTSYPIPVEEGETYAFQLMQGAGSGNAKTLYFRFLDSGNNVLNPLDPSNDNQIAYSATAPSKLLKAPTGAVYAQFCVMYGGTDYSSQIQFVKTNIMPEEYYPFYTRSVISIQHLPIEVEKSIEEVVPDLEQRVEILENTSSVETINIANSDKIGFFSNSFLNGYCMKNHHAINNLSMFSDYIMYNYGHSGATVLSLLNNIENNNSWLGAIPVQDWGIRYGVIAMCNNDGALYNADSDTYYQNVKHLCEAIKSMGGVPILSTEHNWSNNGNNYYYAMCRLRDEFGYIFMEWGMKALNLRMMGFTQFYYNNHPATRTAWLWSYGMKPYLDSLPRPRKSIKLFRLRDTSLDIADSVVRQSLVYNTNIERAERFLELTCGVSALNQATEEYFDMLNLGLTTMESISDEYQKIQNQTAVDFGNCALVELITPYDRNNIKSLDINFTGSGISSAFCKKTNTTLPYSLAFYISFGVSLDYPNAVQANDTIVISGLDADKNLNGTYTVAYVINGIIVTTTVSTSSMVTSGTDTPTCVVNGGVEITLDGSYKSPSADYLSKFRNPIGEWQLVTYSNGKIELSESQLKNFTDFDKVSILLIGTDISISDIQATVSGAREKTNEMKAITESKEGTSLFTEGGTTFGDSDTYWSGIGDLATYTPVRNVADTMSEPIPFGLNVKILNEGESVYQQFNSNGLSVSGQFIPSKLQVKILARYFPKYIAPTAIGGYPWSESEITENSFDVAKLGVYIMNSSTDTNPMQIAEIPVGAWWNEFVFDFDYVKGTHLMLRCNSKHVHLAKCDIVKID